MKAPMKVLTLLLLFAANVALANSGYDDGNTVPGQKPPAGEQRICQDLPPLEAVQVRGFVQNRIRSNQSCLFTVSATGIDFSDNASSTFKIELLQNGYHLGIKNGHECDIGSMPSNAVINNTIVRVKTLCKRADAEGNPLPDEEFISLYLD